MGQRQVEWHEILPLLAETAGAIVLEELAIDHALERELASRGIETPEALIKAEVEQLKTMLGGIGSSEEISSDLLERVRSSRGLGPARFRALLVRNARLRALVRDDIHLSDEELSEAFQTRYGPKVVCRIIVTGTEREAADVRRTLTSESLYLRERFASEAMKHSLDESGTRGGLLNALSLSDPNYPTIVRKTLERLAPGEVSPVIGLDKGYALLLLEETIPAETPPEDARDKVAAHLRMRKERLAMDRLAKSMLQTAGVSVSDESLRWSWSRRSLEPSR